MIKNIKLLFSVMIIILSILLCSVIGSCEEAIQHGPTTQLSSENETTGIKTTEAVNITASSEHVYIYERFTVEVEVDNNAEKWDLTITYPDSVKLISGSKTFKGTKTANKKINLVLLANKNGFQQINITGSVYYKDIILNTETNITEEKEIEVGVDKQFGVNVELRPDSLLQDLGEGNELTNCRLKSITSDVGVISPFFNSDKTSYILIVPENAKKVKISAEAESGKTTIEGTGEYDLSKTKEILICSTSENGNIRTYSLKVLKGYNVLFQQDMNGECISLIDIGSKTPPDGFSISNMNVHNKMISVWMMPFLKYRVVRGVTSDGTEEYYAYNTATDLVTGLFLSVKQDGVQYVYIGVEGVEPESENLVLTQRNIYGKTVDCFQYNDINLSDVVILPLYDTKKGKLDFYEYNIELDRISLSQEFRQEAEATSEETPTVSVAVITSVMPVDNHTVKSLKESLEIRDTIILVMLGVIVLAAIAFFTLMIVHLSYKQQKFDDLFEEDEEFLRFDEK